MEGSKVDSGGGGEQSEYWRSLLSGEDKGLAAYSRLFRSIPSAPRCKLCMAPFEGPVAPLFRIAGFRRWALNQQLCSFCVKGLDRHKGGAELPVSLLFADVRGSTTLAETMTPSDYRAALDRFFSVVSEAVDSEDGVIDHIVGDGVMAMWIPGFVGSNHPERAISAGRKVVHGLQADRRLGESFPAGVGVHTGVAFVGVVGEKGSHDFTVIGDTANTVARLGSAAAGGELMMSESIVKAALTDTQHLELRMLDLKGKSEPFPAFVETASREA
jgi:adenylate cyclase